MTNEEKKESKRLYDIEYRIKTADKRKLNRNTEKAKEKTKIRNQRWYSNNKEKSKIKSKEYHKKNPEYRIKSCVKKYGLSLEDFKKIFKEQNGCCKICGKHQSEFKKRLSVDHNHSTGKVRGLLCINCNRGLGSFKDNIKNLKTAVVYIINNE